MIDTQLTGQGVDALANIERAILTGGDNSNKIDASAFTLGETTLFGMGGDDELLGSPSADWLDGGDGADKLLGGAGNDTLIGGIGSDTLEGEAGSDEYLFDDSTDIDSIKETSGSPTDIDHLNFETFTSIVNIDLITGTGSAGSLGLTISTPNLFENISGGSGPDVLRGNHGNNRIVGNDGDDTILAEGGNDELLGGLGVDTLDGGNNDDLFVFESNWGIDTVADPSGNDTFDFSQLTEGMDFVMGSFFATDGVNSVNAGTARIENLIATQGDDEFIFENDAAATASAIDNLDAQQGTDTLDYSAVSSATAISVDLSSLVASGLLTAVEIENVLGGAGNDTLVGNRRPNDLIGGPGTDDLSGLDGPDRLDGGLGSDILRGGNGNDVYSFSLADPTDVDQVAELTGEGIDLLDFTEAESSVLVDLTNDHVVTGGVVIDVLTAGMAFNFEHVNGTPFDDEFTANGNTNQIAGTDGNDRYIFPDGLTGNVNIIEEAQQLTGDGIVEGVGGIETLDFSQFTTSVAVDLNNTVHSPTGGLTVRTLDANGQLNSTNFENVIGGSAADKLTGNDNDNLLEGMDGDDILTGNGGNDVLVGGEGNNTLSGGTGDDRFVFESLSAPSIATLQEDEGTVSGGAVSSGGRDTIDLSSIVSASTVVFDLSAASNTIGTLQIDLQNTSGTAAPENYEIVFGSDLSDNDLTGNSKDNVLLGGFGVDTLNGGDGDDVLAGRLDGDTLRGGAGRDLLFGGGGADGLFGGTEQDILVGGSNEYTADKNLKALETLQVAWNSSTSSYSDRIDQIMSGIGDDMVRLAEGDTVNDDSAADSLDGDEGLDWLFSDSADIIFLDPDGETEVIE